METFLQHNVGKKCPPRDLNSHNRSHWYLKPARLPIPPGGLKAKIVDYESNPRKTSLFGVSGKRGGGVEALPVIRQNRVKPPEVLASFWQVPRANSQTF